MIFQILAFIILLLFYGCYFIKMMNQKKNGTQTDQLGKGKTGFSKFVEVALKTASFLVPIAEIISIALNITGLPAWTRILGTILAILGLAAFVTAVLTMRGSWRAGVSKSDQTSLVTNGIFQISRNPAFLGFDLVYAGILLMFFNWALLILSVLAVLIFHLQIVNNEEEFLLEAFGDDYLQYKKKVNRYLGRKLSSERTL